MVSAFNQLHTIIVRYGDVGGVMDAGSLDTLLDITNYWMYSTDTRNPHVDPDSLRETMDIADFLSMENKDSVMHDVNMESRFWWET